MNISLDELKPIIEVCGPIFAGMTFLYYRLSTRIDKVDYSLRETLSNNSKHIDSRFDHIELRLGRIVSDLMTLKQKEEEEEEEEITK